MGLTWGIKYTKEAAVKPFITSKFKQDEASYLEQDTRERTPAIVPEAIASDYNKEEIFDLEKLKNDE